MSRIARVSIVCGAALFAASCVEPPPPPPPPLQVTADKGQVTADGVSTVVVTVSGASGPVRLTATQGTWQESGRAATTLASGNGSATLVTCDSRLDPACKGPVKANASADNGSVGSVMVEFKPLEFCKNNADDDGDGNADCADSDCLDKQCQLPSGSVGTGSCTGAGQCVCDSGAAETCTDGVDNNCDGKADCADPTCANLVCTLASGFDGKCTNNACACPGTAEDCGNNVDDDCDGLIDCEDSACQPTAGQPGKVCDPLRGLQCSVKDGNGVSSCDVCPGSEPDGELSCKDGRDNDCDGLADCADSQCDTKACTLTAPQTTGVCSQQSCKCLGNGGNADGDTETTCGDGFDNDCDGKIDCADTDCADAACGANGLTCKGTTCGCSGNGGAVQTAETACNDGADNDCDGIKDCEETYCRPVGNNLGQVCDARGNTCSPPGTTGTSSCTVCGGGGGVALQVETNFPYCNDGKDNDCDGLLDCQDPDCGGSVCSATGMICSGSSCGCASTTPEAACDDFVDNDCDGTVDCADQDCKPSGTTTHACKMPNNQPSFGTTCNAAGACACSGNGGPAEATEGATANASTCGDGFDNDCDGLVDCADPNCRPVGTGAGKDCSQPLGNPVTSGMRCDAAGTCICSGNGGAAEAQEVSCNDGKDNDCDGKVDCLDPSCGGLTCAANGKTCSGINCTCPTGTAEACNDFRDNNCDGIVDCLDAVACPTGTACNPASANYQCTATKECKDITSSFTIALTAAPARIAANGVATATVTATLKNGTVPVPNASVGFAVTSGSGTVTATATTNTQGVATATYTAGTSGGPNTITASYNSGTNTITNATIVQTPALGQVQALSQQTLVMGVRFSSYNESNELTFKLLDADGQPYPPGLQVDFTHSPVGGSFIGSTPSCTATVCSATGTTDAGGQVKVTLHSGTVASVVAVTATASAGGVTASTTVSNIAIVGAKTSGRNISVTCTPRNVPGFVDHNCNDSLVNATVSCTASFGDRFNNILGVQTTATFQSEAGLASGPAQTDPKTGQGRGSVLVGGNKLPADVAPITGEFSDPYFSGCQKTENNPRDGLVTVIVRVNGEEGFIDGSNGKPSNGVYDLGENFIDLAEPFVDYDDNGLQNGNEPYTDLNNNNQWDGPNGAWDANTVVWAQTRVLYSGLAEIAYNATTGQYLVSRWFDSALPPPTSGPTAAPAPFSVQTGAATSQRVYFADQNFNQLTANTAFAVSTVSGSMTVKYLDTPNEVDNLGLNFTQQFCTTPTGGTCSNSCGSAPCYVVTQVGGFAYGNYGTVELKGGNTAGPAEVRATATYSGVSVNLSTFGTVTAPPAP